MTSPRSSQWYAGTDRNAYIHRAWMRRGLPAHAFDGRPAHRDREHRVRPHAVQRAPQRGRREREAGRLRGRRDPAQPAGRVARRDLVRPTAMLWRNMAAMATEEMLRANPIDGVVLLGGCDKTIPALLMAAASVDIPARRRTRRPDADRHLPGHAARLRHRRVAAQRGGPRRHALRGRQFMQVGVVDDPQPRALQHDGHRLDDGRGRRGARA